MSEHGEMTAAPPHALARLRLGLPLVILSWFPFAQIVISVARHGGNLASEGDAEGVPAGVVISNAKCWVRHTPKKAG